MDLRRQAALKALDYVQSRMVIGLGTGRTAAYFVDGLAEMLRTGKLKDVRGVPTSQATAIQAKSAGIQLTTLAECCYLDLVVDGADEVDGDLNLIKGLGRALLREKIIEVHTNQFIVVVDEGKLTPRLGRGALPVEILPFEAAAHIRWLNTLGCLAEQWLEADGSPAMTDNGNYLALCRFEAGIPDAYQLARSLADRPGIVEHGLFLDMARRVIVAGVDGVRILERKR